MAAKKKSASSEVVVAYTTSMEPGPYELAREKAKDPNMTTAGNPLAEETPVDGLQERIIRTNMERLHQDARSRRGPNGFVYTGIMSTRFGG